MTGEDVYDVARTVWCQLCNTAHPPCEDSPAFRDDCAFCGQPILRQRWKDGYDTCSKRCEAAYGE